MTIHTETRPKSTTRTWKYRLMSFRQEPDSVEHNLAVVEAIGDFQVAPTRLIDAAFLPHSVQEWFDFMDFENWSEKTEEVQRQFSPTPTRPVIEYEITIRRLTPDDDRKEPTYDGPKIPPGWTEADEAAWRANRLVNNMEKDG